jgi:hypothetical protein
MVRTLFVCALLLRHQADYAARLDTPDRQVLLQAKREGIALPLAEVPQLRALASALKVRCRAEVAERRFDDAVPYRQNTVCSGAPSGRTPNPDGQLNGDSYCQPRHRPS